MMVAKRGGRVKMAAQRINQWSGPRSLSTALIYSWAQRKDTTVVCVRGVVAVGVVL